LRFVPRFKTQIKAIANAQKCIGKSTSDGNVLERAKNGMAIISILITWALENAIETANSMKSRGYGLKGRTHFSIFRFEKRDIILLILLVCCTIIMLISTHLRLTSVQFFPMIIMEPISHLSLAIYIMFLSLVSLPMLLNIWEDMKWKSIKSKI